MNLKTKFEQWTKGEFIPKNPDQPETLGGMGMLREGEWRQPLLIRLWSISSQFYLKYWQWIIGILAAFALKAF
ncbi:MAG: hypothetical protein QX197_11865 [Methylococcaceae bacterium]